MYRVQPSPLNFIPSPSLQEVIVWIWRNSDTRSFQHTFRRRKNTVRQSRGISLQEYAVTDPRLNTMKGTVVWPVPWQPVINDGQSTYCWTSVRFSVIGGKENYSPYLSGKKISGIGHVKTFIGLYLNRVIWPVPWQFDQFRYGLNSHQFSQSLDQIRWNRGPTRLVPAFQYSDMPDNIPNSSGKVSYFVKNWSLRKTSVDFWRCRQMRASAIVSIAKMAP